MSQMQVARLVELGKPLEVGTAPKPEPTGHDVLVRVEACCLVPNSLNLVTDGGGDGIAALPELPCVFGLDAAGTVEAVGDRVFGLKKGDRVYVDPQLTCGTCHHCRRGRKDVCENHCLRAYFAMNEGGKRMLTHYPYGALSEFLLSPDANLAVIPPSIDLATASRLGYIGTSFGALKKAGMGPGKSLLIHGVTGTLGYAAAAIALGLGCTQILGIGRNKERLAELEKWSPNGRIKTVSSEDVDDIPAWISEQTGGLGPDALYDCLAAGVDADVTTKLVRTVKKGGRAVLSGGATGELHQGYTEAMVRDVAVVGSVWFSSAEVDELIALVDAGVIDLSFLRHEFFPLAEVNEAFKKVAEHLGGAVNVVVQSSK